MKRRELIKGLGALGAMALFPGVLSGENHSDIQLHLIGLGQAGTNAMAYIHERGIDAKYSCITGPYVSHLKPEMKHLFYQTHRDYRIKGIFYKVPLELTSEMKEIFKENHRYVILTGLGASVGTGFIRSLLDFMNSEHKNYLAICSLPFRNEGRSRFQYANQKKTEIEGYANVLFFDHQTIEEEYGDMSIKEKFKKGNELFYKLFVSSKQIRF